MLLGSERSKSVLVERVKTPSLGLQAVLSVEVFAQTCRHLRGYALQMESFKTLVPEQQCQKNCPKTTRAGYRERDKEIGLCR